MGNLKKNLVRLKILLAFLLVAGCFSSPGPTGSSTTPEGGPTIGGGSPVAPPAPPAEVPAALTLPKTVSIGVDKTRSGAPSAPPALIGPNCNGAYCSTIAATSNIVQFTNTEGDKVLDPLQGLLIPTGTDVHETQQVVYIGANPVLVRMNFENFGGEGCSGNTAVLPICLRMWFDEGSGFRRKMQGAFTALTRIDAATGELTAGHFRIVDGANLFSAVTFDRQNPDEKKETDYFLGITGVDSEGNPTVLGFGIHAFARQSGPDATALKTVNAVESDESSGVEDQGIGQWLENDDYWSGSFVSNDPENPQDFHDVCAQISTGNPVDNGLCVDRGIDTAGIDFVPFATLEDVVFTADFPPAP
jgi:hypothetical protein